MFKVKKMKTLAAAILVFISLGIDANAQQVTVAKPIAETSAMSEKIVRGAPFSAEAVNESVQVLADGNRIVRSSTNKLYRNSEGRFRREISGGSGGSLSSFYKIGAGTTILDPVLGFRYVLDLDLKTARVGTLREAPLGIVGTVKPLPAQAPIAPIAPVAPDKIREELKVATQAKIAAAVDAAAVVKSAEDYARAAKVYAETIPGGQSGPYSFSFSFGQKSRYETRKEDLGTQNIEGVEAVGVRTITTIPAGDIGNERPIEMVYEKWYSNELQLVVMSKQSDPRFGDQTYRLTNIVRSEPDPSLFEVPPGFKVVSGTMAPYKISTSIGTAPAQNVVYTKTPAASTTVKPARP